MQARIKTTFVIPALLMLSSMASAEIIGINGTPCAGGDACFDLTARSGYISLGDGNSLLAWGYGESAAGEMQYPGPTLIVNEGEVVQVTLTNTLDEATSMIFPGQTGVVASGGTPGLITNEVEAGAGSVTYTFTASEPGTYMYQSGSHVEVQVEMGLVGALIVRPTGPAAAGTAYGEPSTAYDREFLFFLTAMDRRNHEELVDQGLPADPAGYSATLWFINGRNGPDTMHPDNVGWLPLQPYGALVRMEPAERVLLRIINAGADQHPFHTHGNNVWIIARDGRVLESAPGASGPYPDFDDSDSAVDWLPNGATLPDEAVSDYTVLVSPGNTYDSIFTWTGKGMNWDIYGDRPGHMAGDCGAALEPFEDPESHCLDLEGANGKVVLPEQQAMAFGGLWTGSPYMGQLGTLPPDQGGLNPAGGFSFMWHSHAEKELTNDDVFPGGMMTMAIVEAPGTLD